MCQPAGTPATLARYQIVEDQVRSSPQCNIPSRTCRLGRWVIRHDPRAENRHPLHLARQQTRHYDAFDRDHGARRVEAKIDIAADDQLRPAVHHVVIDDLRLHLFGDAQVLEHLDQKFPARRVARPGVHDLARIE